MSAVRVPVQVVCRVSVVKCLGEVIPKAEVVDVLRDANHSLDHSHSYLISYTPVNIVVFLHIGCNFQELIFVDNDMTISGEDLFASSSSGNRELEGRVVTPFHLKIAVSRRRAAVPFWLLDELVIQNIPRAVVCCDVFWHNLDIESLFGLVRHFKGQVFNVRSENIAWLSCQGQVCCEAVICIRHV